MVSSVEEFYNYVDKDSLPSSLGGSVNTAQSDWISYQQVGLCLYSRLNASILSGVAAKGDDCLPPKFRAGEKSSCWKIVVRTILVKNQF